MGTVWQAVQLSTRRDVALKLMSIGAASPRARIRFDREVEITAQLEHPNIARIYDSGLLHGNYYYAMELIHGQPLDEYVDDHRLSRRQVLQLMSQICRAVQHAHVRGVIHRDLKPSNILISGNGEPHLVDFGLAKAAILRDDHNNLSIDGEVVGTPAYMSPEQASGHFDKLDTRTDVYSLGVILFQLTTGRLPHDQRGNHIDVMHRVREQEVTRPRSLDPKMDPDVEAILLKALARLPDQRYASAGEFAQDIENYLSGDLLIARPPTTIYFLRKRLWRYRVPLTVAAVVVLLLLVTGVYSYVRISEERNLAVMNEHEALVQLAQSQILQGTVLGKNRQWDQAKAQFDEAARTLAKIPAPPFTARLGAWWAERSSPGPMNQIVNLPGNVVDIALFPDGRRALYGGADGAVRIVDLATGQVTAAPGGHASAATPAAAASDHKTVTSAITRVAIASDGKTAASASRDGTVIVWDTASTGPPRATLHAPGGWVTGVILSADGTRAITVSGESAQTLGRQRNDTICVWEIASGQILLTLSAAGRVDAMAPSPDGSRLVTAGSALQLWNVSDGGEIRSFANSPRDGSVTAVAFAPDGRQIISGTHDGQIIAWDVDSGAERRRWSGHTARICALAFDAGGGSIISGSEDNTLRRWDSAGPAELRRWMRVPEASGDDVRGSAISASGQTSILFSAGRIAVWDLGVEPGTRDCQGGAGTIDSLAFAMDGAIAIGRASTRPVCWDTASGRQINLPPTGDGADAIAVAPALGKAAIVHTGTVSMIDLAAGSVANPFSVGKTATGPQCAVFLPDGSGIVTAGQDGVARLWNSTSGQLVREFKGAAEPAMVLAASGDRRWLLTGSRDKIARRWDVQTGAPTVTFTGHEDAINAVAISPDSRLVATGSGNSLIDSHDDYTVRLWDAETGASIHVIKGHTAPVRAIAFSPDGSVLASGSDDGTVRFWNTADGSELRTIEVSDGPVTGLCFSPSGDSLLCAASTPTVVLWNFSYPHRRQLDAKSIQPATPETIQPIEKWGQWYALQNNDRWALDCLTAAGDKADPMILGMCAWRLDDRAAAAAALRRAMNGPDANPVHIQLCLKTLAN